MKPKGLANLEYVYFNSVSKSEAYLLLHGIRGGINETWADALFRKLRDRDNTVLAFNFPYLTRGQDRNGMSTLEEELDSLQSAYDFLNEERKSPIHIIGKSFGGIVASHWLSRNSDIRETDISIMGYVPGEDNILPNALRGKLRVVIQGEHDRYASPSQVKSELAAHQVKAKVFDIPDADHSYRNIKSSNQSQYEFLEKALNELLKLI